MVGIWWNVFVKNVELIKLKLLKNKISLLLKRILFVTIYMVVLTIVTNKNGEPVHFEEPIPKVKFIRLISCSLYNSWFNLKHEGSGSLGDKEKDKALSISKIPP